MKMLKKTVPLWAVIVALLAVTSVAVAAVVVTRQVSVQFTISSSPDMEILDTDQSTILTSMDFGTVDPGSSPALPVGADRYYIENAGNTEFWVRFNIANLPADVVFKLYLNIIGDPGAWYLPNEISTFSVLPGEFVEWYAYMPDIGGSAPAGTHNPTLTFNAYSTASG